MLPVWGFHELQHSKDPPGWGGSLGDAASPTVHPNGILILQTIPMGS